MFDNDELFGTGKAECRAKQEPFISQATRIIGSIPQVSLDVEAAKCSFRSWNAYWQVVVVMVVPLVGWALLALLFVAISIIFIYPYWAKLHLEFESFAFGKLSAKMWPEYSAQVDVFKLIVFETQFRPSIIFATKL